MPVKTRIVFKRVRNRISFHCSNNMY